MKLTMIALLTCLAVIPSAANEIAPAQVADGISVESAWVRPVEGNNMSEVFLVVNNATENPVTVSGVRVEGQEPGTMISAAGTALESIRIPVHAELYMTEQGVRVLVQGRFEVGSALKLQLNLSGVLSTPFEALVAGAGEAPPDHHDYVH